jgi:hypothetical protein
MAADGNVAHVLIDRLKSFAAAPHGNVTAFRSVAARLHSRAASQGAYVVLGCVVLKLLGLLLGAVMCQELAFVGYVNSRPLSLPTALALIP